MAEATLGTVLFKRGDDASPQGFDTVKGVRNISSFGAKNGLAEITDMESVAKEYIGTLPDGMEFSVECNMMLAEQTIADCISDVAARTIRNYQLFLVHTSDTLDFAALPLGYEFGPDPNNPLTVSFSFKISGPVSFS